MEPGDRPPGWDQNKFGSIWNRMAVAHGVSDVRGAGQSPPTSIP